MYVYDEYDQRIVEDRVKQFCDQTRRYLAGACRTACISSVMRRCCA